LLVLLDLIGFNEYNDTFGYPGRRRPAQAACGQTGAGCGYAWQRLPPRRDEFAALLTVEDEVGQLADLQRPRW